MTAVALRESAHALDVVSAQVCRLAARPTPAVEIVTPLHPGRSAVKIPFGRAANGKMVSIDAVIRGLACECFCAACDAPLVARKGEKNQHHFAHYVETDCAGARETSIHNFAKHAIANALEFRLPDDLKLGAINETKVEEWLDGIRPDVLVWFNDELVAVEIRVAHPVPPEKIQKLVVRELATLEIDLSAYKNADKNEQEWTDLVLRSARRFWLFEPAIVRAEIERKAREEAERREREAQRERDRIESIKAAARREAEWRQRVDAEQAERTRKYLERRKREEQEQAERERAELEYQNYQKQLKALQEKERDDRLLQGLKICADTKWHFEEWERRQREAALRRAPQ